VPPTTAEPPGAAVVWLFDPWRERPRTAALAALCGAGMCAIVVGARLPFLLAAALCVSCIAALAPAMAPVECRLDDDGVARRGPLGWNRRPWSAIARAERVRAGVLVSPFSRRHWLDATRAMLLPMPAGRRKELQSACLSLRDRHAR
jgi:hypothetical protein